jgi:N-acyl-L-homoserine lactone synthetase
VPAKSYRISSDRFGMFAKRKTSACSLRLLLMRNPELLTDVVGSLLSTTRTRADLLRFAPSALNPLELGSA